MTRSTTMFIEAYRNRILASASLAAVLLLGFALRVYGVAFGLPYVFHADEPRYVISSQILFKTQSIDPKTLPDISISSFVYVINALVLAPYYFAGRLLGIFGSVNDIKTPQMLGMGIGFTEQPETLLLGRFVTVGFSCATILLAYLIGYRLDRRGSVAIGILSAFFTSTALPLVVHSKYITPDTFVTFFVALGILASVEIMSSERTVWYIVAGIAIGCAVSSKANGILLVFPVTVAHLWQFGPRSFFDRRLWLAAGVSVLALLFTSPYIIGDFVKVLQDFRTEGAHYATGHMGMEGDTLSWYVSYLANASLPIVVCALLGAVLGITLRNRTVVLIALYTGTYFIFINQYSVRNDRTIMPIFPLLSVLAAYTIYVMLGMAWTRMHITRTVQFGVLTLSAATIAAQPLYASIVHDMRFAAVDGRTTSRIWIAENLQRHSTIVLEAYSPYISPEDFDILYVQRLIDESLDWFLDHNVDYVVASSGMFQRFYDNPERYKEEIGRYESLFEHFSLLREFTDNGYTIRVYSVGRQHQ